MKIVALRLFALTVLLGASSWAVWGDDHKRHTTAPVAKPTTTLKSGGGLQALPVGTTRTTTTVADATSPTAPVTTPIPSTATIVAPASKPAVPTTVTPITTEPTVHLSLSTLSPTPEMWFYEQMRQDYNNPTLQMRLRGEREAAERRARLASRKWYGVSTSRPMAHVTPFTYYYSPFWASNMVNPFYWTNRGTAPTVIVETARRPVSVSGFGMW